MTERCAVGGLSVVCHLKSEHHLSVSVKAGVHLLKRSAGIFCTLEHKGGGGGKKLRMHR